MVYPTRPYNLLVIIFGLGEKFSKMSSVLKYFILSAVMFERMNMTRNIFGNEELNNNYWMPCPLKISITFFLKILPLSLKLIPFIFLSLCLIFLLSSLPPTSLPPQRSEVLSPKVTHHNDLSLYTTLTAKPQFTLCLSSNLIWLVLWHKQNGQQHVYWSQMFILYYCI